MYFCNSVLYSLFSIMCVSNVMHCIQIPLLCGSISLFLFLFFIGTFINVFVKNGDLDLVVMMTINN